MFEYASSIKVIVSNIPNDIKNMHNSIKKTSIEVMDIAVEHTFLEDYRPYSRDDKDTNVLYFACFLISFILHAALFIYFGELPSDLPFLIFFVVTVPLLVLVLAQILIIGWLIVFFLTILLMILAIALVYIISFTFYSTLKIISLASLSFLAFFEVPYSIYRKIVVRFLGNGNQTIEDIF